MGVLEELVATADRILSRLESLEKTVATKVVLSEPTLTREKAAAALGRSVDWANQHPELMPPCICGRYVTEQVLEWRYLSEDERRARYGARIKLRAPNRRPALKIAAQ